LRYTRPAILAGAICAAASAGAIGADARPAPAPNGIAFPHGYKDWRVISVSDRTDNHTMRVIVGNDIAVAAARAGRTSPWPEGAIIGKVVWKLAKDPLWPTATVPGELVHVEFMAKDSRNHAATGGWGFSRWRGMDLQPHGKDATFVQECFSCHTPAKGQDYVFTRPAAMP
jgi:hypothetical protein